MNKSSNHSFETQLDLDAEAAEWVSRVDAGLSEVEAASLARWRSQSPSHEEAFARLSRSWEFMAGLREAPAAKPCVPRKRKTPRLAILAGFAALAAALALCLRLSFPESTAPAAALYATSVSEESRTVSLEDGSVVELARGTRLSVRFSPGRRDLELLSGEANFSVAKDKARPFVVQAGAVSVRAVGTVFRVQRLADNVAVRVSEGRVQVEGCPSSVVVGQGQAPRGGISLVAGESALLPLAGAIYATGMTGKEVGDAGASLQFDEKPLREIVEDFNRRGSVQLVLADPSLAALPLSGRFRTDNTEAFVRLLESAGLARAERRSPAEIVLLPAR